MNYNIYKIDWARFVSFLMPSVLRREKLYLFIRSLLLPIQKLHTELLSTIGSIRYFFQHNGQVIYLEKVLNEAFVASYDVQTHYATKEINILEGEVKLPEYIYLEIEQKPVYPDIFLYSEAELRALNVNFIIEVPTTNPYSDRAISELTNKYKLPGKSYKIIRI